MSASRATTAARRRRGRDRDDGADRPRPGTVVVDLGRAPRDLLARMAGDRSAADRRRCRRRRVAAPAGRRPTRRRLPLHGRDRRRPRRGLVEGLHRARAAEARDASPASGRARAARACPTSGPGSPSGPARCPSRSRPGPARARSRSVRRPRTYGRRLPADAAPRRAPGARGADGPLRRLVAAVALRRRGRRVLGRPRGRLDRRRVARSASSSVSGPDVVEALERIYPCHVADIQPGRSRYALLLNERGHVMDDGMILRESETRFVLSFTSGGAANAEMWLRDWIDTWGLRVHVMDRTMSLAAINVTGPLAGELLQRARAGRPAALPAPRPRRRRRGPVPRHAPVVHRRGRLGAAPPGRPSRSSSGGRSWRPARDLGIRPHGLQALFGLRLEKGHVIVGHGHGARHDPAPHRHGLGGPHGQAVVHRPGRAGAHRQAPRRPALGRASRWTGRRRSRARRSSTPRTARSSAT